VNDGIVADPAYPLARTTGHEHLAAGDDSASCSLPQASTGEFGQKMNAMPKVVVSPVVLGHGKRLFPGGFPATDLELAESRQVGADVLVLIYRPATLAQPS
jgi:hypothetical protein